MWLHNAGSTLTCALDVFTAHRDTPLVSTQNLKLDAGTTVRLRPSDWALVDRNATLLIETIGSHRDDDDDPSCAVTFKSWIQRFHAHLEFDSESSQSLPEGCDRSDPRLGTLRHQRPRSARVCEQTIRSRHRSPAHGRGHARRDIAAHQHPHSQLAGGARGDAGDGAAPSVLDPIRDPRRSDSDRSPFQDYGDRMAIKWSAWTSLGKPAETEMGRPFVQRNRMADSKCLQSGMARYSISRRFRAERRVEKGLAQRIDGSPTVAGCIRRRWLRDMRPTDFRRRRGVAFAIHIPSGMFAEQLGIRYRHVKWGVRH